MYRSLINFIYDVITEMEEFTEEKLILFVQEYKNLYDLGNTNYHNSLIRENSWEEIGQRLKTPGN